MMGRQYGGATVAQVVILALPAFSKLAKPVPKGQQGQCQGSDRSALSVPSTASGRRVHQASAAAHVTPMSAGVRSEPAGQRLIQPQLEDGLAPGTSGRLRLVKCTGLVDLPLIDRVIQAPSLHCIPARRPSSRLARMLPSFKVRDQTAGQEHACTATSANVIRIRRERHQWG